MAAREIGELLNRQEEGGVPDSLDEMPEERPTIALADQTAETYRTLCTNNKVDNNLRLF